MWITLVRDDNTFLASYAYPASLWDNSASHCDVSEIAIDFHNQVSIINMPESVYVGLAVSTPDVGSVIVSTPKLSLVTLSVEVAKAHVLVLAVSIELPPFLSITSYGRISSGGTTSIL